MSDSPWRWTKRGLLVLAGGAAVSAGTAMTAIGDGSRAHYFSMVVASFGLFWWCWVDSRMRGTPIPHGVVLVFLFTWPLSAMTYLIWSRGVRGLGITLLATSAFFALLTAGAMLGSLLVI